MSYHSGFVALVGRPNVGKSTLLNAVLGRKIAIATPKPQTTRISIRGILHSASAQLVLVDTPGVHRATSKLGHHMVRSAKAEARGVDALWHIVDVSRPPREEDQWAADMCRAASAPTWLIANKSDLVGRVQERIRPYQELAPYQAWYEVSALKEKGLERLIGDALQALPEGDPYFPEDMVTDQPEDTYVGETIREQILMAVQDEVPHSVAVVVEERTRRSNDKIYVRATIYVERESQKAIIIGAKGKMLRKIGEQARVELETYYERSVYLDLWVKVRRHWREQEEWLKRLGFQDPE